MHGVFLDWATVSAGDVTADALDDVCDGLDLYPTSTRAEVLDRVVAAEIILTNKIRIDAAVMDAAPDLALICLAATGYNNVDLDAARVRGVAVCNIRDYCTDAVAQHVFSLILALNQHLAGYQRLLQGDAWQGSPQFCLLEYPIHDLAGRTLVIVGYGTLGRRVAELGQAFGMQVEIAARPGSEPPELAGPRRALEDLLPTADVVSLHCPLTDATRGLFDAVTLSKMKPDALLINTARGAIVDAAALAVALRDGRIGGAGIDVLAQEPPVDGDPLLDPDIPNLIVTPHVAWATVGARGRAVSAMADNVTAFRQGRRQNRVD
jgi:glycerate dehydrogenase